MRFNAPPADLEPGNLTGFKFYDEDGDGEFEPDEGEYGLADWWIEIENILTGETWRQLTGPDGSWWFEGVPGGSYQVREIRPHGWTQTTENPPPIFLDGNTVTSLDVPELAFGNYESDVDFGDAPSQFGLTGYPTLLANDGARHTVSRLGLRGGRQRR